MNHVTIHSSRWANGVWVFQCAIVVGDNTYVGPHRVELPEDATQAQIHAALLAQYGAVPSAEVQP